MIADSLPIYVCLLVTAMTTRLSEEYGIIGED